MRRPSLKVSLFLCSALVPSVSFAQTVPSAAQPSRVEQQFHYEDQRPAVGGTSIITVPDESGKAKHMDTKTKFKLKAVTFENLTAFSKNEIAPLYADYLGKDVTIATLNDITGKITAKYRNAGYILSRAVLPPQSVTDGAVKIRIVEGFVNKVTVQGPGADSDLIHKYAEKIRSAKPLNTATLERYLLLMEDLPGVSASAVLRPAAVSGASDVVVTLTEKKLTGAVTLDNRGTRYIGPVQAGLTQHFNNLFGVYDHTLFRTALAVPPSQLQFYQLVHEEQIGSEGTKVAVGASHTLTQPNYRVRALGIDGVDTTYFAQLSHPFVRSRQTNWYGNVEYDYRDTKSETFGVKLYRDREHVARVGTSFDFLDRFAAVNRIDAQFSQGLGISDDPSPDIRSRAGANTSFSKFNGNASRLQPIYGPFGLYVAAAGQASSEKLITAEQFGIGGPNFGSAYDPSEITGDSGIAGRVELQYSRYGDFAFLPSYQFYGFYDIGEVWFRNPGTGIDRSSSLASAGGGVRFNILEPISGSLEVAVPLTRDVAANSPNNGDEPRVFFSLAYRY